MGIDMEWLGLALGTLAKVVVIAMMLERALAFVFEFDWIARMLTESKLADGSPDLSPDGKSRVPGLKSLIALSLSWFVCSKYQMDALAPLFGEESSSMGVFLTALIVAGGSAAAIALFQGVLGFGKSVRDMNAKARQDEAKAKQLEAEAKKTEAEKKLDETKRQ